MYQANVSTVEQGQHTETEGCKPTKIAAIVLFTVGLVLTGAGIVYAIATRRVEPVPA